MVECFFYSFMCNVETYLYVLSLYFLECEKIKVLKNYIIATRYFIFVKQSSV